MMKVHLLRSKELSVEAYGNVLNLVQRFPGPVRFISSESEDSIDNLLTRIWEDEDKFSRQEERVSLSAEKSMFMPKEEPYQSWDYFFRKCESFRRLRNIPSEDHVILLTDIGNDMNWFGSVGPSMKDYFIQTSHWDYFFGEAVDVRFPIAYEVAVWLIRSLMFERREDILNALHKSSRGCANDFCRQKQEIILKMRTADLCTECMEILQEREVSPLVANQLFNIVDGIRENMTFRGRSALIRKPSRVEVRGLTQRLFLTDLGDLELRLNPKERAIYLFFLKHPEGVRLVELQDHRAEISSYYSIMANRYESEEIEEALSRLLDPMDNNINEVISRIKRKLRDAVGEDLLDLYLIQGAPGEVRRIPLDREFVSYSANDGAI
jgi:hypothetical protein